MATEYCPERTRRSVPDAYCMVPTARCHGLAIWRKRHAVNTTLVSQERDLLLTGSHFPQFHCLVATRGGNRLAVRGISYCDNGPLMPFERDDLLPGVHIEDRHLAVAGTGENGLPIWCKGHRADPAL